LPLQETYVPGGGRGHMPVDSHAVAVGELGDLRSVKLSTTSITLKPGATARIDVTIEISDLKHLEKVIKSLKGVEGVLGVERAGRAG